ncbi:MAG TPA: S8 family peptidase, partial [Pseudoxanthomonas sp.]|nr:S8 family peptidase [Pseudoxanthomonas sp.]
VVVAVLDTGYTDHRDLIGNVVAGYDFISLYGQDANNPDVAGDGDGRDADAHDPGDWVDGTMGWCGGSSASSWHGTHVAGTVAAVGNNAQDIAGVAYGAKVQPVRVLGHCGGMTSDIADAIVWASGGHVEGIADNANPAEVINMSLGGSGSCADDPVTQEAIDGANNRGVTIVVAAGNDNDDAAYHSPASCKGVITVGASGVDGGRSYFSNYGASVALSAPGGNATSLSDPDNRWIWSTGNTGTKAPVADTLMGYIGTSQASPHVAGVVAMMQSAAVAAGKPALTPVQVKQILRGTARPFLVTPPTNKQQGAGLLDAAAATLAATQDISDDDSELLVNRIAVPGQTGGAGDTLLFKLDVPTGMRSLNLRTYGGSGDVSIYVSRDSVPTSTVYDRKSAKPGNSEAVVITNPSAGTYYLRVVGETAFANVTVNGLYQ